jgi:hypothetical protein
MKTGYARAVGLAVCVIGVFAGGTAYSCVQCVILPERDYCSSGWLVGSVECWVSSSCWTNGPCGPGGCFLPGTVVETADGPRGLEEVQVGDMVLGVDDNGNHVFNEVVGTIRSLAVDYYVINGAIEVTGTHPFLVDQRWVRAEGLCVGDVLDSADGTPLVVESITRVDRGVRTFNLSVSGNHTFFADGVLVHNKEGDPNDP